MTLLEPIGTKPLVKKDRQVKFYVPSSLMRQCEEIFDRQGVDMSEGMTRLVRLLVEAPDDAVGLMLGQAHGTAAVTLALGVLRQAGVPIPEPTAPAVEVDDDSVRGGEGKPLRQRKVRDLRKG